ncbi:spore coat protein CotF [Scopulibacillus daqui]|uniref:Spore coat protein CotF n=1 Tax=Scopulibacillus daqui TaxID=1469162 RepID=A0ABS2Q1W6_9BACL|nr:spore coat protein [Scopulibacillus daqui]MBM7646291.1 spore coat protein CotF [Scopulibacillus daqui]
MSCFNTITNMGLFLSQVQCQELKSLLQTHFPLHVQDYNMKVEFLSKAEGPASKLQAPPLNPVLQSYTQAPIAPAPAAAPRTNAQTLNDREIATAYLLTLKRAGREYGNAVFEVTHPELRSFLEQAFLMGASHSYDVYQYMVKKGFYPLEAAPDTAIQIVASMYQVVPQNQ